MSPETAVVCAVCGSEGLAPVRREGAGHKVLGCPRCGVWSIHPQPGAGDLDHFYNAPYYEAWRLEEEARERMWQRRIRLLEAVPRGKLLDVGCAEGAFLAAARRAGFEVEGTEISRHAAGQAATAIGAVVHHGDLRDAALPRASFDIVTIWHVLEHMLRPGESLREARRILKPGGFLLVAVPNRSNTIFGAVYRIARGRPLHLYEPDDREQHLHYWDPASLQTSLASHGFDVEWIKPDPCALGAAKQAVDLAGRIHSRLAGEPRTSAMVALARAGEEPA